MILVWLAFVPGLAPAETLELDRATLTSPAGSRAVILPHRLDAEDFPGGDGRVRFRLDWTLPARPDQPLAIYVPKLSLAGQLWLNGTLVGACGAGALEHLRCLHQPQLFKPPPDLWRLGPNVIELEIYGNTRQMNGLSRIRIGSVRQLYAEWYLPTWLWKVELLRGMSWLATCLGGLALAIGWRLRSERIFLWFGLCALVNALSNLNVLVTTPPVDIHGFNWFVFTSRLETSPLALGMLLAFFRRLSPTIERILWACTLLIPWVVWYGDSNRSLVIALYVPILVALTGVAVASVRWACRSRNRLEAVVSGLTLFSLATAILDWLRLRGRTDFEGVYWLTYVFTGFMLAFGVLLVFRLAAALIAESRLSMMQGLTSQAVRAGFWEWDLGSNRITWSPAMLSLFGYDPGAADRYFDFWSAWRERLHPNDLPAAEQAALAAAREQQPLSLEYRIVLPNGDLRWIETRADILSAPSGDTTILSGISLDVTDRKLNEMELEHYRNELERRVLQRTEELREAHDRLLAVERDQARQSERRHLLQEMHDGFGSQLATARLLLGQQQMTQAECTRLLGECLDDLRLLADTLSATESTLERALANFRFRLQNRLARYPVRIHWRIPARLPPLSERRILQFMRILQESLSNALAHAQANQIEIEVRQKAEGSLVLSISDDGVGLPETIRHGRGLGHMEARARAVDARLDFIRLSPGTRVQLTLPPGSGVNA